jgi:hypothetical protein
MKIVCSVDPDRGVFNLNCRCHLPLIHLAAKERKSLQARRVIKLRQRFVEAGFPESISGSDSLSTSTEK